MYVTLSYNLASTNFNKDFKILSANFVDVEIETKLHKGLNGAFEESPIGYRFTTKIDFEPIGLTKEDVYWLYGFVLGNGREGQFNGDATTLRDVSFVGDALEFDYFEETFFANGFSLLLIENQLRTITDTGSTRIFKPTYSSATFDDLSGETLTRFVDFVDENTIGVVKKDFRFINRTPDDLSFTYYHKLAVNFGYVNADRMNWLIEFCLWKNKQIDTTLLDPANGKVFDVVFAGKEMKFEFENGVQAATTLKLMFYERLPRATPEEYVPSVTGDPFILDVSELDGTDFIQ